MDEELSDYQPTIPYFRVNLELFYAAFVECHIYSKNTHNTINIHIIANKSKMILNSTTPTLL